MKEKSFVMALVIITFIIPIVGIVAFVSCSGGNTPSKTAQRWIDAWATGNEEEVYATTATSQGYLIDYKAIRAEDVYAHITIDKEVIVSDRIAYVTISFDDGGSSQIWLIKEDDGWRVDVLKTLERI